MLLVVSKLIICRDGSCSWNLFWHKDVLVIHNEIALMDIVAEMLDCCFDVVGRLFVFVAEVEAKTK